eukprot:1067080-Prymnesium_polylepis.1
MIAVVCVVQKVHDFSWGHPPMREPSPTTFRVRVREIRIWRAAECEVRDVNKTSGPCRGGGA